MPQFVRGTSFFTLGNAGWSESWYFDSTDLTDIIQRLNPIITARMGIAPIGMSAIGKRVGFVDPPHAARSLFFNTVNSGGGARDTPFQSALFVARTGSLLKSQVTLRGFPDDAIVNGAYQPNGNIGPNIAAYFQTLQSQSALIRSKDPSQPLVGVASVSGAGAVVTYDALTLSPGNKVKFFRTRDTNNKRVGKTYEVLSVTDDTHFTLNAWETGRTVNRGRIQKVVNIYAPIASYFGPYKIISRKVGRPFGEPVGRRRART